MRPLFGMLIVMLFGCNTSPDTSTTSTRPDSAIIASDSISRQKISPADSTIYQTYIPTEFSNWLHKELPGFIIPDPSRWDHYWFTQYKKDSSIVSYVPGDFNCDGIKDHALILVEKGTIVVYAFLATGNGFQKQKLETYDKDNGGPIDIGLELLTPGTYAHLDGDNEPAPANIRCPAIQLVYFEKAAVTYYWEKRKFRSIQTGD